MPNGHCWSLPLLVIICKPEINHTAPWWFLGSVVLPHATLPGSVHHGGSTPALFMISSASSLSCCLSSGWCGWSGAWCGWCGWQSSLQIWASTWSVHGLSYLVQWKTTLWLNYRKFRASLTHHLPSISNHHYHLGDTWSLLPLVVDIITITSNNHHYQCH